MGPESREPVDINQIAEKYTYNPEFKHGPTAHVLHASNLNNVKDKKAHPHRTYIQQQKQVSKQSAGLVRFLTLCSISIFLLASLVTGRRPRCTVAGNVLYHTNPLEYQICSSQKGRSRVGPAIYVFSLLGLSPIGINKH
jgi:hypothetical protein